MQDTFQPTLNSSSPRETLLQLALAGVRERQDDGQRALDGKVDGEDGALEAGELWAG